MHNGQGQRGDPIAMAKIDIRRPHSLSLAQARKQVSAMAEHLKHEFDLVSTWNGNQLEFKRSGVNGVMTVNGDDVHVAAELGFLVALLKPKIESRLHAHFDDIFGKAGAAAALPASKKAPAKKAAAKKSAPKPGGTKSGR